MINITIYRNSNAEIYGFKAENHGDSIVCSAVSALTLNTVNSIEAFTSAEFVCDYEEEGGFLSFELTSVKNGGHDEKCGLLLNSLTLGLRMLADENRKDICLTEEVH